MSDDSKKKRGGYIKLHRSLLTNDLFQGTPYSERDAWVWLLLNAYFKEKEYRPPNKYTMIPIKRGQIPVTYKELREKWKWGNGRISNYLKLLVINNMIEMDTGCGFMIITVCNYEEYQGKDDDIGMQVETQVETTLETQSGCNRDATGNAIYKKEKESKEEKEGGNARAHTHTREAPPPIFKNDFSNMLPTHRIIDLKKKREQGKPLSEEELAALELDEELSKQALKNSPLVQAKVQEMQQEAKKPEKIDGSTYRAWLARQHYGEKLTEKMEEQMKIYQAENGIIHDPPVHQAATNSAN